MFFDIDILTKQCKGDSITMLKMLENYYFKKIPRSSKDVYGFAKVRLKGYTWLPNPEKLFSSKADIRYKRQYLILRSKVNILMINEYGLDILDLSFYPDIDKESIRHNPLIEIKNNVLYFKI